jgi:hypothetical protein
MSADGGGEGEDGGHGKAHRGFVEEQSFLESATWHVGFIYFLDWQADGTPEERTEFQDEFDRRRRERVPRASGILTKGAQRCARRAGGRETVHKSESIEVE